MKLAARSIVPSILFFIFYFLFFISPVSAQSQNPQINESQPVNQVNPYLNPNTNPDVPKNQHIWTQTVMIDVMSAMACQLTGIDLANPKSQCLGVDPETGNIGFVENGGGAIGVAGKMIAMLYTPPLHTGDYFKYLASNFGVAKPTYAQAASGFEGLKPIQSLWIAFRDIVYLLFVIIFIIIGLAIMLRIRLDPRTVMTIQNQIPRIIIGLLLLTFSFAIAGFLIDMMYVVIFLSYELISSTAPTSFKDLNPLVLQEGTPFTAANSVANFGILGIAFETAKAIYFLVSNLLAGAIIDFVNLFLENTVIENIVKVGIALPFGPLGIPVLIIDSVRNLGLFDRLLTLLGIGASEAAGSIVGVIGGIIAFLIVAIALLIVLIRLWFALIMAYVSILLDVVFAPFWIAASLLPGSPIGFTAWLRSIIANLAVFPATIIMFLLAKAFIDVFGTAQSNTAFVPPLVGNLPGTDQFGALIALGIIFMTPGVVNMVKQALRAPSVPGGGLIAGGISAGASPYMAGGRAVGAARFKIPSPTDRGGWQAATRQIFRF